MGICWVAVTELAEAAVKRVCVCIYIYIHIYRIHVFSELG